MKRILFMPFLQISSGHHHAADAMIEYLLEKDDSFYCEKVDILSYSYGKIEGMVSAFYMKWIHFFPGLYSWIYRKSVSENKQASKRFLLYEQLFLFWMEKLMNEKKPHLIICTHALPSYMLNLLKRQKKHTIPVINVYTDYFINRIWGIQAIDYHFAPSQALKDNLVSQGVEAERIIVTGIPIHPRLKVGTSTPKARSTYSILISGGSLGAGSMRTFVEQLRPSGDIRYIVLCGKNKNLYHFIKQMSHPMIEAMEYISKEDMNRLYNETDAIITKPGGVTISESLYKRIPIFVYHALPGQEEMNLRYLKKQGLIFHLEDWRSESHLEEKIRSILDGERSQSVLKKQLNTYHQQLSKQDLSTIVEKILTV